MVLYFGAAKDPAHIRGALDYVANPSYWKTINIEEESYVPVVLFRYGRADVAYRVLLDLSAPAKQRREYPEVSYSVIAGIVSGAMGIEPAHAGDRFDIQTLAQPASRGDELSLRGLRIRGHVLDVTHTGDRATRIVNCEGKPLRWKAMFLGSEQSLIVDGKLLRAEHGVTAEGIPVSWMVATVSSGQTVTVSRETHHATH